MELIVNSVEFDPARTFLCGQCFRWKAVPDGGFEGVAHGRRLTVSENGGMVRIGGFPENEEPLWREYFDLDTDYSGYIERLSEDETLAAACRASAGIHILRQEPFETLISFIISQNNNIPRISGIVERLCQTFGERIGSGDLNAALGDRVKRRAVSACGTGIPGGISAGNGSGALDDVGASASGLGSGSGVAAAENAEYYSFPTAKRLEGIEAGDLAPLRAGFRARYIADAVARVNSGEVDFEEINALPLDKARERLKTIVGVGDKVADCVLLFAFRKPDAFPKDVWVKRIMAEYYPGGLPACTKGIEGIAQQYLFDYIRNIYV